MKQRIKTTLFILILISQFTVFSNFVYAVGEPYDTGASVTGLAYIDSSVNYCGQLYSKLSSGQSIDPAELNILGQVYDHQCLKAGLGSSPTIYSKVINLSKITSIGSLSCSQMQRTMLANEVSGEPSDQQEKDTFIKECFELPEIYSTTGGKNEAITLGAPLPIEGGDVVEASNKTYLFVYMVKMYRFVIGIAGVFAVVELIIAGFQVGLSAGDTSRAENGKKRLIQTLEGLGILFTSTIILNTINPLAYNYDTALETLQPTAGLQDMGNYSFKQIAAGKVAGLDKAIDNAMTRRILNEGKYKGELSGEEFEFYGDLFEKYASGEITPELLAALATQETGLGLGGKMPYIRMAGIKSTDGGVGLMQFITSTGQSDMFAGTFNKDNVIKFEGVRRDGVIVCPNQEIDDRCQLEKSVKAAAIYMADLNNYFKDTVSPMGYALLGYNAGQGYVRAVIDRISGGKDKTFSEVFNADNGAILVRAIEDKYTNCKGACAINKVQREILVYAEKIKVMCLGNDKCKAEVNL